jgi:hypothetical protein
MLHGCSYILERKMSPASYTKQTAYGPPSRLSLHLLSYHNTANPCITLLIRSKKSSLNTKTREVND